jgi:RHS repeat-associated protein
MKANSWIRPSLVSGIWLLAAVSGHCFWNSGAHNTSTAALKALSPRDYGPSGFPAIGPMAKGNAIRGFNEHQADETDIRYYGFRYYNASTGKWLSRDPAEEQGFALSTARGKRRLVPDSNAYGFVNNATIGHYDYLGLTGTGSDQASCSITPYNSGRVSFRGFSPQKLAEFRLIDEYDPNKTSTPNLSGTTSDRVDGFWWKGIRTHWYKLPDFCWAVVEPEFSKDGFSVKWCCDDCTRLLCKLSTIFKARPCTPGFVPNSGNTHIGKYPFED